MVYFFSKIFYDFDLHIVVWRIYIRSKMENKLLGEFKIEQQIKELKEERRNLIDWLYTLDKAYEPNDTFRQKEEEAEKELEINVSVKSCTHSKIILNMR